MADHFSHMHIDIVFEHADFLLINKPADSNFHDEGALGQGVFNQVKKQCNLAELYPVHRLDKMTSGLLLFAKTSDAASQFGQLFSKRRIDKYYLAISKIKPKKKQGLIQGDMEKSRRGSFKLLRTCHNPAKTRFFSYSLGAGLRLFVLKPLTGRTHQLRVALNSLGSSIAGDPLYNSQDQSDRGYLHAWGLRFHYQGEAFEFICPPDQGELFASANSRLQEIAKPWLLDWPGA
ncbi:TIGR01621 family pseudouridine synthase [Thalassotalea sp. HSM 43]|uniref:TIGR01621 family pseudouridine synthase n=1 Tax=Thalassotalea sp. HSM 43 TaxID=2552945 RepID=UPI001E3A5E72|nr:TIGR01621 family pseudouridine synthase [Thalassotalea sp. HSM 43]